MLPNFREFLGFSLTLGALGVLWLAVLDLRGHDYLSAILLAGIGSGLLRAGMEFVRPSVGE